MEVSVRDLEVTIEHLRETARIQANSIIKYENSLEISRVSNSDLSTENEKLKISLDGLERELRQKNNEVSILQRLDDERRESTRQTLDKFNARYDEKDFECSNLKIQLHKKTSDLEVADSLLAARDKRISDFSSQIEQLEKELITVKSQCDRDTRDMARYFELEKKKINENMQKLISEHNEQISNMKNEHENQVLSLRSAVIKEIESVREAKEGSSSVTCSGFNSDSSRHGNSPVSLELRETIQELQKNYDLIAEDFQDISRKLDSKNRELSMLYESFKSEKLNHEEVISEKEELLLKLSSKSNEIDHLNEEIDSVKAENLNLSSQLQHLLWVSSDSGKLLHVGKAISAFGPSIVTSSQPLSFEDISDLQSKNIDLVKENNKLAAKLETLKKSSIIVEDLKQARVRMENMIAEYEQKLSQGVLTGKDCSSNSSASKSADSSASSGGQLFADSDDSRTINAWKLEQEKTIQSLKLRNAKLEESEKLLKTSLNNLKEEFIEKTSRTAELENDAKIFQAQSCSFEKFWKDSEVKVRELSNQISQNLAKINALNADIAAKDTQLKVANNSAKSFNDKYEDAKVKLEVAAANEKSLLDQMKSFKDKINEQKTFLDAISRIEVSLTSNTASENVTLNSEKEKLLSVVASLRKEITEKTLLMDQYRKQVDDENKVKKLRLESTSAELAKAREDLVHEQTSLTILKERFKGVERQLQISEDSVKQLQKLLNPLSTQQNSNLDGPYVNANIDNYAEIESLKQQLELVESHSERYKQLYEQSEENIKEISEAFANRKAIYETKKQSLESEVDELTSKLNNSISELNDLREMARLSEAQHDAQLKGLNARIESLMGGSLAQLEALKTDAIRFQNIAKISNANFEKECAKRIAIEKELAASLETCDSLKAQLLATENSCKDALSECEAKKKLLLDYQMGSDSVRAESTQKIAELSQINDLLHSQMQSLSRQVEKYQGSGTYSAISSSNNFASDNSDLEEYKKTVSELREVLRYMKRERELLEAKFTTVESENFRQSTALQASQRIIDELRTELKVSIDKSAASKTEEEFNRLMNELNKANIINEDNFKLRHENDMLTKKLSAAEAECKEAIKNQEPLKSAKVELNNKIVALEEMIRSLNEKEIQYKDRLNNLSERYSSFDVQHTKLKEEFEKFKASCAEKEENIAQSWRSKCSGWKEKFEKTKVNFDELMKNKESLESSTAEKVSLISTLNAQIESLSTKVVSLESKNNVLESQKSELDGKLINLKKKQVELTESNSKLTEQVAAANTAAASAATVFLTNNDLHSQTTPKPDIALSKVDNLASAPTLSLSPPPQIAVAHESSSTISQLSSSFLENSTPSDSKIDAAQQLKDKLKKRKQNLTGDVDAKEADPAPEVKRPKSHFISTDNIISEKRLQTLSATAAATPTNIVKGTMTLTQDQRKAKFQPASVELMSTLSKSAAEDIASSTNTDFSSAVKKKGPLVAGGVGKQTKVSSPPVASTPKKSAGRAVSKI